MTGQVKGTAKQATVYMVVGGPIKVSGPIGQIVYNDDGSLHIRNAENMPLLIAAHREWRYVEFIHG